MCASLLERVEPFGMDVFVSKLPLFLLSFIGCVGQDILLEGPVDAILGRDVTLKPLIDEADFVFIIWYFNDGIEQTHIATLTTSDLKVNEAYEGRVSINKTNGYLTLGPLKLEDSGNYSINVVLADAATKTREVTLRVLAPTTISTLPTSSTPEPTKQCTGCVGQDILLEGPVDAILGRDVTLKPLIDEADFVFIIWIFIDGIEQTHIATLYPSDLKVNEAYEGRVSINKTNGYLTLGPLKLEDSGDYSITVLSADGATKTGEVKLRVLAPTTISTLPTSSTPEPTKQCTGCVGQDILLEGPVDAILGRDVTLKPLIDEADFVFIIWIFIDGIEQTHIATLYPSDLKVNEAYEGRVSINKTNGYLTLGPLKLEDSGDYSITVLSADGATKTGEVKLRVLAPTTISTLPTSSTPEPTKECTDYFVPLVLCVVVIVALLAGDLLLLYRWMKTRNFRTSNSRNMELPAHYEKRSSDSEESTYQDLSPASRDRGIYSTLTGT